MSRRRYLGPSQLFTQDFAARNIIPNNAEKANTPVTTLMNIHSLLQANSSATQRTAARPVYPHAANLPEAYPEQNA
jgi:hypothetical protein